MTNFCLNNFKVKGISTVIPKEEKSLLDEKNLYGGDERKIKRVINSSGFLKRKIADKDVLASDLCYQAAEDLISNLKVKREEIDALIFLSYTPDYIMPATSYVLHKRLNLSQNCICMDIPQACSGYVIGLFQAGMLINSGCKNVLLLVGDCFSKFTDMFNNNTAPVFGDAGSATFVEYNENASKSYFSINSSGEKYDALICKNGGFRNIPHKTDFYENENFKYESSMNGGEIFDFTMINIAPSIKNLLAYSNHKIEDFDQFFFHQANRFILTNIASKLNIPIDKISTETLTNFGNQCGASIPCTISNIYNQEILKQNKCLLSGFGAGLSWANVIIDLNLEYCSTLNFYNKGDKHGG